MWGIIIVIAILIIAYLVHDTLKFNNLDKNDLIMKDKLLKQLNKLNLSKSFVYAYRNEMGAIGINEIQKKVVMINKETDLQPVSYDFKSIIGERVKIDGNTVTSTSVGETVGRSLVGGAIAGGIGAVIGGLSGSKTSQKEIKSIDLEILINDLTCSSLIIPFFTSTVAMKNEWSDRLKQAEKDIVQWENLFKVIIYQNEHPSNNKGVMN